MNKYKHHLFWLSLPAVVVVLYFIIFQPRPESLTLATTTTDSVDAGPVGVIAPGKPDIPAVIASSESVDAPEPASGDEAEAVEEVARDREFINYAFPLLSTWNLQEIKPLLANATIEASTDEELDEVMSVLGDRLGDLKYFETPQPVATRTEADEAGEAKLQHYQFVAYYEAGVAEIDLILRKQLSTNSLYSFNIHVPN
jgi:hypothetical protein